MMPRLQLKADASRGNPSLCEKTLKSMKISRSLDFMAMAFFFTIQRNGFGKKCISDRQYYFLYGWMGDNQDAIKCIVIVSS